MRYIDELEHGVEYRLDEIEEKIDAIGELLIQMCEKLDIKPNIKGFEFRKLIRKEYY